MYSEVEYIIGSRLTQTLDSNIKMLPKLLIVLYKMCLVLKSNKNQAETCPLINSRPGPSSYVPQKNSIVLVLIIVI